MWISHNYTDISSLWAFLLSPITLFQVITESQTGLPVLHSNSSPAIHFTYDHVYMLMLVSPFIPLFPSLTVFTSLFSTSVSPFLPCKQVHQYHLSRFHIYAFRYDICFSLSDLLLSVKQTLVSSIALELTQISSFCGWVVFHCIYTPHLHLSMDI